MLTYEQSNSILRTFYHLCLENRHIKEEYYIVIDMELFKAIRVSEDLDILEDKYKMVPILISTAETDEDVYEICVDALSSFFKSNFELKK